MQETTNNWLPFLPSLLVLCPDILAVNEGRETLATRDILAENVPRLEKKAITSKSTAVFLLAGMFELV